VRSVEEVILRHFLFQCSSPDFRLPIKKNQCPACFNPFSLSRTFAA